MTKKPHRGGDKLNKIKALREEKGITQIGLANILEVTQGAISQWETGDSLPRADKLVALAKILDCTVDELLMEESKG